MRYNIVLLRVGKASSPYILGVAFFAWQRLQDSAQGMAGIPSFTRTSYFRRTL
jgi:hypothetical protein